MALSSAFQWALQEQARQLAAGVKPASVTTTKVSLTATPAPKPVATTKPTLSPTLQAAYAAQEAQLAAGVESFGGLDYTVDAPSASDQEKSAILHGLIEDRIAEQQQSTAILGALIAERIAEQQQSTAALAALIAERNAEMEAAASMLPWRTPQPATAPSSTTVTQSAPGGAVVVNGDALSDLVQSMPATYADAYATPEADATLADAQGGALASMFEPRKLLILTAIGLLTGIWLIGSN